MKKFSFFIVLVAFLAVFFIIQKPKEKPKIQPQKQTEIKKEEKKEEPKIEPVSNILVAVGDVMLSRHVGSKIRAKNDPKVPFLKTAEILKKADLTFCNLESPFYDKGPPVKEGMVFKAEPEYIQGLKYAGFDLVSLANNHFGDRGLAGMNFTFTHLKNNKIEYIGAGENLEKAREAKILEKKGIKFAFLGYNDLLSTITPESYKATSNKPGVNPLTEENLKKDIKKVKEKADVVIVSFHWGSEYQEKPKERQRYFGRLSIESGASLVLGHHPHVIQPYEKWGSGYIFYSLGNFVFDQMWSEKTRKGIIARIYFKGKEIEKVETIPVTIYDLHQPKVD